MQRQQVEHVRHFASSRWTSSSPRFNFHISSIFRKWGRRLFQRNFWPLNAFFFSLFSFCPPPFFLSIFKKWPLGFILCMVDKTLPDSTKMKGIRVQGVLHLASIEEEDLTFRHLQVEVSLSLIPKVYTPKYPTISFYWVIRYCVPFC